MSGLTLFSPESEDPWVQVLVGFCLDNPIFHHHTCCSHHLWPLSLHSKSLVWHWASDTLLLHFSLTLSGAPAARPLGQMHAGSALKKAAFYHIVMDIIVNVSRSIDST